MAGTPDTREIWFLTSEIEWERAGSFRQERWAQVFLGENARVRFFNVQGATHLSELPFDDLAQFNDFRDRIRGTARLAASVREGWYVGLLRSIKHLLLVDFYLPNILRLIRTARERLKDGRRVVIFASSPPFAVAGAGWLLKLLHPHQVILVVDMRDAWALHDSLGGLRPLKRAIERRVLRDAAMVSTVSVGLSEEFNSLYHCKVDVLYNVATHCAEPAATPIDWSALSPLLRADSLKFVYTGSTPVGFYDVGAFARAVAGLRRRSPELADRVQFLFVGACAEVKREAAAAGVADTDVIFVPLVPQKTALALQHAADAVVFLAFDGENNRGVVTTKFFEYLALRKPILPFGIRRGSDVDRLLEDLCGESRILISADQIEAELFEVASKGVGALPRLASPAGLTPLFSAYRDFARRVLDLLHA